MTSWCTFRDERDLVIEELGGICPVQGFGTLDGERFYFRYRHDDAQLEVGPQADDDPYGDWGMPAVRLYAEINGVTGDHDRGWLNEDQATALLCRLVGMLRPVDEWPAGTYQDRLRAMLDALVVSQKQDGTPSIFVAVPDDGDRESW